MLRGMRPHHWGAWGLWTIMMVGILATVTGAGPRLTPTIPAAFWAELSRTNSTFAAFGHHNGDRIHTWIPEGGPSSGKRTLPATLTTQAFTGPWVGTPSNFPRGGTMAVLLTEQWGSGIRTRGQAYFVLNHTGNILQSSLTGEWPQLWR